MYIRHYHRIKYPMNILCPIWTPHRECVIKLDIDATEIVAHKTDAKWTYNKNNGFMPMVGHMAETGHVVSVDFSKGNVSTGLSRGLQYQRIAISRRYLGSCMIPILVLQIFEGHTRRRISSQTSCYHKRQ